MLDGRWRANVERSLEPVGKGLQRAGINADVLTVIGLGFAVGTAFLIASGHLVLAVFGVIATGVPDILDGTVARNSGRAGPRGSFLDSVFDRMADAVLFGGVAWFLAGEGTYLPMLAFAALGLSMLISYERAKAESLGFTARGGIMERAERMVLLGFALFFNLLVPALWLLIVLTSITAVQRFVKVWRQASDLPARPKLFEARHRRMNGTPGSSTDRVPMLARWREQRGPDARREARRQARAARRSLP
jgi:CDP-diacylglycerol---glycerol-3-phosphate 3-phosphatidyltransferase